MVGFVIRVESAEDIDAISGVVAVAFESGAEADLVNAIRDSDRFIAELSLVALVGGDIVGHVMVSHADLKGDGTCHEVAVLAPLAVHPGWQRQGIGSALVRGVVARAEAMGEPMVVLEGGPQYYGRLGFEHSVPHGIVMDLPDWAPREAAQVMRLAAYDPTVRGKLILPPAFDEVESS